MGLGSEIELFPVVDDMQQHREAEQYAELQHAYLAHAIKSYADMVVPDTSDVRQRALLSVMIRSANRYFIYLGQRDGHQNFLD